MLRRPLALSIALLVSAALWPRPAFAADPVKIQQDAVVVKDTAAQDEQKKWFKLKKGDTVRVIYERETWYWVKTGKGQQAWIQKKFFELRPAADQAEPVPTLEPLSGAAATDPSAETPATAELKPLGKPASSGTPDEAPAAEAKPESTSDDAAARPSNEPRDVELRLRRLADDLAA
ncbi:MAG: hypothetical protein JXR83_04710, partial [Deltaproteobacteria bacterium]|nr:hypothetical protein [Deltaproteobacteria bacterium]